MSEIKEVANEIIGLQGNKIFRTVKFLTLRPGQVISEYCKGEKQKYLSPVVYFLGVTGILYFLSSVTGGVVAVVGRNAKSYRDTLSALGFDFTTDEVNSAFSSVLSNETFGIIVGLPFALFFTWVFFRKHNKSFRDNSWFVLYTSGHSTLIRLPLFLVWYIIKDVEIFPILGPLFLIIGFLYSILAAKQFYQINLGRAFVLISLMKILSFISLQIITFCAVILVLTYN